MITSRPEIVRTWQWIPGATAVRSRFEHAALPGELVFLCVPDRAIASVARDAEPFLKGKMVVHCSGAHNAAILQALANEGSMTGVFHPLQSFPASVDTRQAPFQNISIGIEADDKVLSGHLEAIARALGSRPLRLPADPQSRSLYHLAAVLASNALIPLMDAAITAMRVSGMGDERAASEALLPLVRGTLNNLDHVSPGEALTGPIARGDLDTIRSHLIALSAHQELKELYVLAMRATARIARDASRIEKATYDSIIQLLR
ncbi:MAG: DUF2520 domain-containing protein [Planctomycetes bacterium]|nr:DUF2520 domain-containing protein [Planctomycetota bacterium]